MKCRCIDEHDRKNNYRVIILWTDEHKHTAHNVLAFNPDEAMWFQDLCGPNSQIVQIKKTSEPYCIVHGE